MTKKYWCIFFNCSFWKHPVAELVANFGVDLILFLRTVFDVFLYRDTYTVANPGYSLEGTTPKVGLFFKLFPKNYMKMKEFRSANDTLLYRWMMILRRSHAGDARGSAYLQALATFLEGEYMNLTLDRIYMMVKQYMTTVSQVQSLSHYILYSNTFAIKTKKTLTSNGLHEFDCHVNRCGCLILTGSFHPWS